MKRNFVVSLVVSLGLILSVPSYGATNAELEQDIKELEQQLKKLKKKSNKRYKKLKGSIDELTSRLDINGFATASLAKANEPVGGPENISDNAWNSQSDNIMGLQLSFAMNEKASYTVQMVSKHSADTHAVKTEWSYLSYQLNNKLRFRAGRIRIPYYMLSESVEVGYSYNWIRPPTEIYALSSNNAEMIDLTYEHSFGLFNTTSRVWFGRNEDVQALGPGLDMPFAAEDVLGLTFDVNKGPFMGHLGLLYNKKVSNTFQGSEEGQLVSSLGGAAEAMLQAARAGIIDVSTDPNVQGIAGLIAIGEGAGIGYSLASATEVATDDLFAAVDGIARMTEGKAIQHINAETYYVNIGGGYDDGKLQILGEFTRFDIRDTLLQSMEGGYITASYRFADKWVPFISYSTSRTHNNYRQREVMDALTEQLTAAYATKYAPLAADPTVQGIAAGAGLTAEQLIGASAAGIAGITRAFYAQMVEGFLINAETTAIGVRYDLTPGIALKAQFDVSKADDGYVSNTGLNARIGTGTEFNKNKVKVLSFAIDTVF